MKVNNKEKSPYAHMSLKPVKAPNTEHIRKLNCVKITATRDLRMRGAK